MNTITKQRSAYLKAWRESHPGYLRAWRNKNKDRYNELNRNNKRKWYSDSKYMFKHRARIALNNAIAKGLVIRPDICMVCSKECKPNGHHEDYIKPLEVIWLCGKCHTEAHR